MLCNFCRKWLGDILDDQISDWKTTHSIQSFEYSLKSLTCDLCSMILEECNLIAHDGSELIESSPLPHRVSIQLQHNRSSRYAPWRFSISVHRISGQSQPAPSLGYYEFVNFGSSDSSQYSRPIDSKSDLNKLDVNMSKVASSILAQHPIHQADSAVCIATLQQWSDSCLKSHSSCCRRKQDQRLPTRVLDVGPSDCSREPYLFETKGQRGTYMTLSHRWGPISKQFQTTKANLDSHKSQIPLEKLPSLFRDAVQVTRAFGIRYLWIDCICIVQDDDGDWRKECEKMSGLYEKSFLTISALTATDSDSSLFSRRMGGTISVHMSTLDGAAVGIRQATPSLTEAIRVSAMNNRGWILQERVLSPAILHYGDNQVYWECFGGQASQTWPVIQSHESSLMKNLLNGAQRLDYKLYVDSHYISWYKLMEIYSSKEFSIETDRLPAILGLANRFQRTFGGTFVAGLWYEDLHRGLLWMDPSRTYVAGHGPPKTQKSMNLPSWSWVSCAGKVQFEWDEKLEFPSLIRPISRIPSSTDAEFIDAGTCTYRRGHRGSVKGFIQMWGAVKRVQWHQGIHPKRHQRPGVSFLSVRTLDVLQTNPNANGLQLRCVMDVDLKKPTYCYCVIIADWTFEDTFVKFVGTSNKQIDLRCYLILQRTKKAARYRNPLDLGEFKRIGYGAADIATVEQFFGPQQRYFLSIV